MRSIELAAEELNPLIPHTAEIIVGFIAFSLLYMVLRRAVVPRFEKAFAERTDAIQGGMERAEKAQLEAEAALKQYKAQLQDARGEENRKKIIRMLPSLPGTGTFNDPFRRTY